MVGKSEEARCQFGTGEHLLTKLRMERRRNESVQIEGKTFIQGGKVVKKGESDVKSEAWKEVRNPC